MQNIILDQLVPVYQGNKFRYLKEPIADNGDSFLIRAPVIDSNQELYEKLLENDFATAIQLHHSNIASYDQLKTVENIKYLRFHETNKIPLGMHIPKNGYDLNNFLNIAIQITDAMIYLQEKNIVHNDISPENILINPETLKSKITGFFYSFVLNDGNNREFPIEQWLDHLEYLAPEQTGRVSKNIDHRSDLYMTGALFYTMLLGRPLFESQNPLELVHYSIAKEAINPSYLKPSIPTIISDIILNLLKKSPENRYQSFIGLKLDLEYCFAQIQKNERIYPFLLRTNYYTKGIHIPQKLYGREREIQSIHEFLRQEDGYVKAILISGESGSGKTSLVNHFDNEKYIGERLFIKGKFFQKNRNIAYSAVIDALRSLVKRVISMETKKSEEWKEQLENNLAPNLKIITELIPELNIIIGNQPNLVELNQTESQNRFLFTLKKFISTFCSENNHLILFLDDLQWADNASLDFIYQLLSDSEMHNFLFIGSYKTDEVKSEHLQRLDISRLRRKGVPIHMIRLEALEKNSLSELLKETLNPPGKDLNEFSTTILTKTNGNPLFIRQFLRMLYDEKFLFLNTDFQWDWHLEKIKNLPILDTVIQVLERRIHHVEDNLKDILFAASVSGNHFSVNLLHQITGIENEQLAKQLNNAVKSGLLLYMNNQYSFVHDRIHDIFYNLKNDNERMKYHANIGNIFEQDEKKSYHIYDIVYHKNKALGVIDDPQEKIKLALQNYQASQIAKTSNAYHSAFYYIELAYQLFYDNVSYNQDYKHLFKILLEAGEIACLNNEEKKSDFYFTLAIDFAHSRQEKITVYEKLINKNASLNKLELALEYGKKALAILGEELPEKITKAILEKEEQEIISELDQIILDDLIKLPDLTDQKELSIAKIYTLCSPASYYLAHSQYFHYLAFRLVRHSLEKGNSYYSAYGYMLYAIILCSNPTTIDKGNKLGSLAIQLADKYNSSSIQSKIYHLYGTMVSHWKEHLKEGQKYLLNAYRFGLESGDFSYISYSIINFIFNLYFMGEKIETIKSIQEHYFQKIKNFRQIGSIQIFKLWYQFISNLTTKSKGDFNLSGDIIDELEMLRVWKDVEHKTNLARYYITKQMMCYILGNYERSLAFADKAKPYLDSILGMYFNSVHVFYFALALMASMESQSENKHSKKINEELSASINLFSVWAQLSPKNFANKYRLLLAEQARIQGSFEEAVDNFDESIKISHREGFLHEEAIASELFSRFWLQKNKDNISYQYLINAYTLYQKWGAEFKVQEIEAQYPEIVNERAPWEERSINLNQGSKYSHTVNLLKVNSSINELEINNVINAAIAISSEIDLSRLLEKMIKLVIETAGAEKGFIILKFQENLQIEAEVSVGMEAPLVLHSKPLDKEEKIAKSIIQYVDRTGEQIIIHDALFDSSFKHDPYIKNYSPKSILCISLRHQENSVGILYLENNLIPSAFTERKVNLLQILLSQSAIALENAMLFNEMNRLNQNLKQEILERKLSQDALYESELRFKRMADNIRDGLMIMENDNVVYANDRISSILGYNRQEINDLSLLDIVAPEDRDIALDFMQKMSKKESLPEKLEIWIIHKDGSKRCIQNRYSSIQKNENTTETYTVTTDVTKRAQAEREMQRLNDNLEKRVRERTAQLEVSNKELEAFSYSVSHDLRAPLRTIEGFSRIFENEYRDRMDETGLHYLQRIRNSCHRMDQLIVDLLTLSRITRKEIFLEKVNLSHIVRTIIENYHEMDGDRISKIMINDGIVAICDANLIRIALENIISNAWKYTRREKITKIEFGEIFEENERYFYIKDNGVGFETAVASKIFNVFQRFHKDEDFEGTGVGLATVQRIIERHGGRVWADSKVGEGSIFYFTLPMNY